MLAGKLVHRVEPLLQFGQPPRIRLDPLAVAAHGVGGFRELNAGRLDELRRLGEPGIELGQAAQPRGDALDLRPGRGLAVLESRHGFGRRLGEARGVGQPPVLLAGFLPLPGVEAELAQFAQLPVEHFGLPRLGRDVALRVRPGVGEPAPSPVELRRPFRQTGQPAVGVEQGALVLGMQQRVVRVLAVDVDQARADLPQLGKRGRRTVDVGPGTAAGIHDPAQQAVAARAQVVLLQPAGGIAAGFEVKLGDDLGAGAAAAHHGRIGALAQRHGQRIHQDRLARPGLAGQGAESGAQVQFESIDDDEVADQQAAQHRQERADSASQALRGDSLQRSFSRSIAK